MSDIKQVSIMVRNMLERDDTPSRKEAADALAVAVGEVLDQIEQLTQTNKELESEVKQLRADKSKILNALKTLHNDCCYQISPEDDRPDRPSSATYALVIEAIEQEE